MNTRTFWVSAAAFAFLAGSAAPLRADDCHATATFKDMKKIPGQRGGDAGSRVGNNPRLGRPGNPPALTGTPDVYELHFDVEVEGCPASAGRPHKFGKAAYGTITYTFHKRYVGGLTAGETDEKSTTNWNDDDKQISITGKLEGKDTKGFFEASDIRIERTVCGCR